MATHDPLRTVQEFANQTGTTVRYGRYLIETRQIEFVRLGQRKVRIRQSVIDQLIDDGTVPPRRVA